MNIVLAIHPLIGSAPESLKIVRDLIRSDPNTFVFHFPTQSKKEDLQFQRLKKFMRPGHFISLRTFSTRFDNYEADFLRKLKDVKLKLNPEELVNIISFGGHADVCYKNISPGAIEAVTKIFGKSVASIETKLKGVYGSRYHRERPQPIVKEFLRLLMRRRR